MTSHANRFLRFSILCAFLTGTAGSVSSQALTFADGLEYNNFYAVTVHTDAGESFTLFDAASLPGETLPWPDADGSYGDLPGSSPRDLSYFLWVRRVGVKGAVTYPLAFSKILEIRFMGPYGGIATEPPQDGVLQVEDQENREVRFREDGRRFSGWFFPTEIEPTVPSFTPAILVLTNDDETAGNEEQFVYVKTDGFLGGIDEEFGTYAMLWLRHDGVDRLEFHHDGTYERCPVCGAVFFDDRHDSCPFDQALLVPQIP